MFRRLRRRKPAPRLLLLGLDCASPSLIFHELADELPHLQSLMQGGTWGELDSAIPCITVPAWTSMVSSRDPGVLGMYGFRNRSSHAYDALQIADASAVQHPRLWDILSAAGKRSLVLNVPQTYPVRPLNGHMLSGFLTPGTHSQFAYPAIFKQEVLKWQPDYAFDVRNFRNVERQELLERIIDLTNQQYAVLLRALHEKEWDFAMHVNIGLDRIHHAFWRYHDPRHRLHEPSSPFRNAIRDYYRLLDEWIGKIVAQVGPDVSVIVASDHGAKRMDGAIAINEWLWQAGWLALKQPPQGVTAFSHERVDWSQTRAWSTGGYYGRIFLNVQGREPQGTIAPEQVEAVRDDLAAQLQRIPDMQGQPLHTTVYRPEAIYQQVNNIAPDLLVYFGALHWRTVGSIGYGQPYTLENDTGPDDANHAQEGLFILRPAARKGRGPLQGAQLMDIAPTVLALLEVAVPDDMQGRSLDSG